MIRGRPRWQYERTVRALAARETVLLPLNLSGRWPVALIYPAPYAHGMANLGFQVVHRLLGTTPGFGVERCFLPTVAGQPQPPPHYSFESVRPLGDFPILAVSLSFEGQYSMLPALFQPLGVPLRAAVRNRRHPIVMLGGAAVLANPHAVAAIGDVLVIGEAETCLPPVLARLAAGGGLAELTGLPGVWVPRHEPQPNPPPAPHDVASDPAWTHRVTPDHVFSGAALFEIMRGCPRGCRFCLARCIYHPPRSVPARRFIEIAGRFPELRDWGLVAPSPADHPELPAMLEWLRDTGRRVRHASVKWERLDDRLLQLLRECGQDGMTLAPETGSPRLQKLLGKPLATAEFLRTVDRILTHGFQRLKLYFMVGLPGETPADLDASTDLLREVAQIAAGRTSVLQVSVAGFVPKPGTPLADQEVAEVGWLRQAMATFRAAVAGLPGKVVFRGESANATRHQARLARIGPELVDELDGDGTLAGQQRRGGAAAWSDGEDLDG